VDVLVLDRARFPRDKPCAEYLSPEASRIIAHMGALGQLEQRGAAQLAGMRVRSPNGSWLHGEFAGAHTFHGFRDRGLAIRRTVLDSVLLERTRAAGARVQESVQVTDLARDDRGRITGVIARNGDGHASTIDASLVIGADGLRSVVARRMGVARRARWPARVALVTHYAEVSGMTDAGEMHVDRDGYLGLAPVGNGTTNVALVVPTAAARAIAQGPAQFLERWLARSPEMRQRFTTAARVTEVRATGPFAVRVTKAWIPGAAVVGDAADFYDPFTGEGIYAALRGAELLAPRVLATLERPDAETEVRRDYDAARQREFSGKWMVERLVALAVAHPGLMNRAAACLSQRKDLADLLVGVVGDFVPPRELLRARFVVPLLCTPARRNAA
jgi:flavin-dependent dehydrogenase